MTRSIAVIGAGVAGHGAALSFLGLPGVTVTLFEKLGRAGGHANTVVAKIDGRDVAVDTGFIVYNTLNYPNLVKMFAWAGVETSPSDMSFALSLEDGGYEWCGRDKRPFGGLFAQWRNLLSPSHWGMLREILAFQKRARADVAAGAVGDDTLARYLAARGFSDRLRDRYVAPMGAAIWSMSVRETPAFPARGFLAFFDNHKLLQWDRPQWRTVRGGSRCYVDALAQRLRGRVRLGCEIVRVARAQDGVRLTDAAGVDHAFDAVVLATNAPAARRLLATPTPAESRVLSRFKVSANRAVLHLDASLMPRRRAAWASWNVLAANADAAPAVTYWMNRLQPLDTPRDVFITLNPSRAPREGSVLAEIDYEHPLYDADAFAGQADLATIGDPLIGFAGAWTAFGFHEDGLRSGLEAARRLGGVAPWERAP